MYIKYGVGAGLLGASVGSAEEWLEEMAAVGARRLDDVEEYLGTVYRVAPVVGIRAEIVVAQAIHETGSFRSARWVDELNPAGLNITDSLAPGSPGRAFGDGYTAALAHLVHVWVYAVGEDLPAVLEPHKGLDPSFDRVVRYGWAGTAATIGALTGKWATDPEYGPKIVKVLNHYAPDILHDTESGRSPLEGLMGFDIGNRPLKVAVGVGHANTSGGNPLELASNRRVVAAFLALAKKSTGFDVRCYTPNEGQGTFPGGLDEVVYATVHKWTAAGWRPDVVFEVHSEGVSNPAVRGGFIIHPDSYGLRGRKAGGGDFIDIDVRAAAHEMAKIVTAEIGVPLRGDGVMSERETGVGGQGWRLGYFGALSDAVYQQNACVFISEAATHSNPTDWAIMTKPDFPGRQAIGLMKALAFLATDRGNWTFKYSIGSAAPKPAPAPVPNPAYDVVPIPALDQFADTAADVVPGFVDFILEGNPYRAIFVGDRWKATKNTPRYGMPSTVDKRRTGVDIPSGTVFDVRWVVYRRDTPGAPLFGRTPWSTFVDIAETNRVGDLQID